MRSAFVPTLTASEDCPGIPHSGTAMTSLGNVSSISPVKETALSSSNILFNFTLKNHYKIGLLFITLRRLSAKEIMLSNCGNGEDS